VAAGVTVTVSSGDAGSANSIGSPSTDPSLISVGGSTDQGQVEYYEFGVPSGVSNITANVSLANDAADPVGAYLISPDGDTLGYGQNSLNGTAGLSLTAYTLNPVPGTWTLIVDFAEPVAGNEISEPFTGNVQFNNVSMSAAGLPDSTSTKLAAGMPVTVPVAITNRGQAPEDFFVDPRLNATASLALAPLVPTTNLALPLTVEFPPQWLVPTQTSSVSSAASATLPIMFDLSPFPGDPDIASGSPGTAPLCTDTPSVSYTPPGGTVTAGGWAAGRPGRPSAGRTRPGPRPARSTRSR